MKTTETVTRKRRNAAKQALASVRVEGLEPSQATQKRLYRYVEGKITGEQLEKQTLAEVKALAS